MSYRFEAGEKVGDAVRRIALEQLDKGLGELEDSELDDHETVHQVRKRCKKLRGLVRLIRPAAESFYGEENDWYREAARNLSFVRDAQSLLETFDALTDRYQDVLDDDELDAVGKELAQRRESVARDQAGLREKLEQFQARITAGKQRAEQWSLSDLGFDAVRAGVAKTFRRGRRALRDAYKDPTAENFHEWRKRVKYHWYHARLLKPLWAEIMGERADEAHRLSDWLGDDHDLHILRGVLLRSPDRFGGTRRVRAVCGLIDARRDELRLAARPLGMRLYESKAKHLGRRWNAYWDAWQVEQQAAVTSGAQRG